MFPKTMLVLAVFAMAALAACEPRRPVVKAAPDDPNRTPAQHLVSFAGPYAKAFSELEPGQFYVQLRAYSAAETIDPRKCLEPGLLTTLRQLFFRNGKSGMLQVGVTAPNGKQLFFKMPLVVSSQTETPNAGEPKCLTQSLGTPNGGHVALTPKYRFDPGQSFKLDFNFSYSADSKIEVLSNAIQVASDATKAFGGIGLVAGALNEATIKDIASKLDNRVAAIWSGSSSAVGQVELTASGDSNAVIFTLNGVEQNWSGVKFSSSAGTFAVIEAVPYKSLFAELRGSVVRYVTDPNSILSQKIAPELTLDQSFRLGVSISANKAAFGAVKPTDADASEKMGALCRDLVTYLTENTGLTADDALIVKWAVLRTYTGYEREQRLRNEKCLSPANLARLSSFSADFSLGEWREPGINANEEATRLGNLVADALELLSSENFAALTAVTSADFSVFVEDNLLPNTTASQWNELLGDSARKALANYGPIAVRKYQLPPNGGFQRLGLCARLNGQTKRIGLAAVFDESGKLRTLRFGTDRSIRDWLVLPSTWNCA